MNDNNRKLYTTEEEIRNGLERFIIRYYLMHRKLTKIPRLKIEEDILNKLVTVWLLRYTSVGIKD